MSKQQEIDWTNAVHNSENNKFSQKNLDKHRHKFVGQAAIIETELRNGKRLNSDYAREVHHIKHLARRIGDLGEKAGIDIDREWGRNKELEQEDELVYFLPENRQAFIDKKWIIDRPRWWYSLLYTPTAVIKEIEDRKAKELQERLKNQDNEQMD